MKARALLGTLTLASLVLAPGAQAQAPETRVTVKDFRVTGNTLLPQSVIDAELAPHRGQRSLAELKKAAAAVQRLYADAGYGAVIAYLPAQNSADGIATIAVVEGRIARVIVAGNKAFDDDNVRRSLPALKTGTTPMIRELDAAIALSNENPARQVAVTLEPGAKTGEVDARVQVSEQEALRLNAGLENIGNANTGRWRANLGVMHAALWGLDHQLALQFQTSPDHLKAVQVLSLNYRVPFYEQGLTLDAFGAYSNVDGGTTSTAVGPLQFSGRGNVFGLRLGKPLQRWREMQQRVGVALEHRSFLNDCSIAGLPPGVCGSAGASVAVQPLTVEYSVQRSGDLPFYANASLSSNLGLGGANGSVADFNAVRQGATRRYSVIRGGGNVSMPIGKQWQAQLRLSAQWTPDALVTGEQFGLAGATTLRGYEEREVTGDVGVIASVELMGPAMAISDALGSARLLGFVDAGKVWNRLGTPCRQLNTECPLASIGLGLRIGGQALQLRLDVAHALRQGQRTDRGDDRVHFAATYSFR
ncbi:ShlB/FhaC/HecB family hemolysin secretion/activation protein [Pelomonas sp. SE-A7]|uniref:ShlB/FhaC/HecB family hemolysin secretion/activation protein n=1 Tax=Pelomonas sp. SE-A7 TaxID=3054953 RepID=UPI00259C6FC5|nr:ShlB/FhaC/HecB family hemolysin secretion/activation protein [Pelomonas sp. SE-A7]MDM4764732.1 ShlB/FhaC/HecB family hemolysin secretion/activation protein [Pelomonas sp. SE-A7]